MFDLERYIVKCTLDELIICGKRFGQQVFYWDNKKRIKEISSWDNGKRHGQCIRYYLSGKTYEMCSYYKGQLNGKLIRWNSNGNIVDNKKYRYGELIYVRCSLNLMYSAIDVLDS